MDKYFDVLIIGGGPAGLSAALSLVRGNKKVLLLDEGVGRNFPAAHMMNFLTREGTPPQEFRKLALNELEEYENFSLMKVLVDSLVGEDKYFVANGNLKGKKVLLAHGIRDQLPEIPGARELFGKSIFHCPYCHGYEYRNKAIGIMANEQIAQHLAPLIWGLSQNLVLFSNGLEITHHEAFKKKGIRIVEEKIEKFRHQGEKLEGVILTSGEFVELDALFLRPSLEFTSTIGLDLGCRVNSSGLYETDSMLMTSVNGVYAAGDIVEVRQSVVASCASGSFAGASINLALSREEFYGS